MAEFTLNKKIFYGIFILIIAVNLFFIVEQKVTGPHNKGGDMSGIIFAFLLPISGAIILVSFIIYLVISLFHRRINKISEEENEIQRNEKNKRRTYVVSSFILAILPIIVNFGIGIYFISSMTAIKLVNASSIIILRAYTESVIQDFMTAVILTSIPAIILSIISIILAIISLKRIKENNLKGKKLAIASIIISIINLLLSLKLAILYFQGFDIG